MTNEEHVERILNRLEGVAVSLGAVREELAEFRGWRQRMDADRANDLSRVHDALEDHGKRLEGIERWRSMIVGIVIGAQTVGMVLTGVVVKLLSSLGWF